LALQSLKEERSKVKIKTSLLILLIWGIWLSFVSTLSLPTWISIPAAAVILIYGAQWWSVAEAAFYLLLASWIYSHFSLTTPGFYWLSLFAVYLVLRLVSLRVELDSIALLLSLIFLAALGVEFVQLILFQQIRGISLWSVKIISSVFFSAFLQTIFCAVISRYLIRVVAK